jgi:hypothetical protein
MATTTLVRSTAPAARLATPPRSGRRQLAGIGGALLAYLAVRFVTQGDRPRALDHGRDILGFERALGLDIERGVQDALIGHSAIRELSTLFYAWGYWPTLAVALVWLWRRSPRWFEVFRDALVLSGLAGLIVFALYPAAPPRMLPGFTDTVRESGQHLVAHPSAFTNPYAALPSFHAGWFFLATVVLARAARTARARRALLAVAPLMSIAVVVTANHYVVDVLLGVGLSCGALAVASRLPRRLV